MRAAAEQPAPLRNPPQRPVIRACSGPGRRRPAVLLGGPRRNLGRAVGSLPVELRASVRLVVPSPEWRIAFVDMARECHGVGDERYVLALRDFDAYLAGVEAGRRREGLPEGWVPRTEFWLEEDGRIIGCVRLRFELTPELENEGGHIGYDIRPSMRRRGYGTVMLRLALAEARAIGIERVLVTCDDDNVGSIAVIERNGGTLVGQGLSKKSGKIVRRYWIE